MTLKKLLPIIIIIFIFASPTIFSKEKLVFAIDLIRHGDRTPEYEVPNSPYHWKEGLGQLTETGVKQEIALGKELRKKYIDQYRLLPKYYHPETIYVRSTDFNRTQMSANSLLLGLYPKKTRPLSNPTIPIYIVPRGEDTLLIVEPSKNIFSLIQLYLKNRKVWKEKTVTLQEKLKYWSNQTGLSLNNFRQLGCFADNLYIRKLKQVALPKGISETDAAEIISLRDFGMVYNFKQNEFTHKMGREFLKTVKNYLDHVSQDKTSLKYVLLSGHDSSIMAVMNILNSPLEKLPGYASRVNFSLFKNDNNYYVKISYNNNPVKIPACGGSTCTLAQLSALSK